MSLHGNGKLQSLFEWQYTPRTSRYLWDRLFSVSLECLCLPMSAIWIYTSFIPSRQGKGKQENLKNRSSLVEIEPISWAWWLRTIPSIPSGLCTTSPPLSPLPHAQISKILNSRTHFPKKNVYQPSQLGRPPALYPLTHRPLCSTACHFLCMSMGESGAMLQMVRESKFTRKSSKSILQWMDEKWMHEIIDGCMKE